ncbi:glycosyltransferase family 2 protein [Ruminococcus sp. YRD2003]|uniref:glycosyltransferase family 2 protein n=1 Tax=Ruminococcus sp. YRD2003 TaxID=1452313 RepID=UPI0009424500
MSNPRIAVIMSSYNGEKFIGEQIDSILAQKDVDVTLYVRDDGSTDNTVNIVRSYLNKGNVKLIVDGRNLRPGLSFLTLLKKVVKQETKYDYYAFADQDDIWLSEKLITAVKTIKDSEKPALYCSNQIIYRNGVREGMRFSVPPEMSLIGNITQNVFSGCTMVLDRELAEIVVERKTPKQDFLVPRCHDSWIFLIACVEGQPFYDHDSYILYRLHDNNVVGVKHLSLVDRLLRFKNGGVKNNRSRSAQYLLEAYPELGFTDRRYVEKMAYYRSSMKKKLSLIVDSSICKGSKEGTVAFILKVIMGYI